MNILGAGMSGMLAGQYFRSLKPVIHEKQKSLPNNHKALLRFRSDEVSTLTGIPFKKVRVYKDCVFIDGSHHSTIRTSNMYSKKVIGSYKQRSVLDLDPCDRYIAPDNFIEMLSNGLHIWYGVEAEDVILRDEERPIISTIPVSTLAEILSYDLGVDLKTKSIYTITATIDDDCDIYQTVYYPNHLQNAYRVSITGNKVILESTKDIQTEHNNYVNYLLSRDFGIDTHVIDVKKHKQEYGKLIPVDGNEVREFIHWASVHHGIYSLGRWATHRQLLMDDVVNDIKVIDKLIRTKGYSR